MKKIILLLAIIINVGILNASGVTPDGIAGAVKKAYDWNIAHPINGRPIRDWTMAPYFDGLIAAARVSGDAKYLEEALRFGDSAGWTLWLRKYHADDHAVGNAWLEIYGMDKSRKERLEPTYKVLSSVVEDTKEGKTDRETAGKLGAWHWCDALYMGPRVYAKLYKETGEIKFAEYMDAEFKKSYDGLYDKDEALFYRDSRFVGKLTDNGKKIFWSRGDGWVIAGLASILQDLPKDYKNRDYYLQLFTDISASLLSRQLEDGSWPMNLGDADDIKGGEVSGTAFFVYAFAWGVNNKILSKEYEASAIKGWQWLVSNQQESGRVVNVQPIGASPEGYNKGHSESYGTGAFAMAGEQVALMLGRKQPLSDKDLYAKAVELYANRAPEAFVKIETRNTAEIAWENDKCAFRMFGNDDTKEFVSPGIDVWSKTVKHPILSRWYDADKREGKSYHNNYGEGRDAYEVGRSVGNGGAAIFEKNEMTRSGAYNYADVLWSSRNSSHFIVSHFYKLADGSFVTEYKTYRMNLGEPFFSVEVKFRKGRQLGRAYAGKLTEENAVNNITPAFGLRRQSADAKISEDPRVMRANEKAIVLFDELDGKKFIPFVRVEKKYSPEEIEIHDNNVVLKVKPENSYYIYKAGYFFGNEKE